MHGVSHVRPEEEDMYQTPPPTHYGVGEAIKARNTTAEIHEVIRARGAAIMESSHHSKNNRNGFIVCMTRTNRQKKTVKFLRQILE